MSYEYSSEQVRVRFWRANGIKYNPTAVSITHRPGAAPVRVYLWFGNGTGQTWVSLCDALTEPHQIHVLDMHACFDVISDQI